MNELNFAGSLLSLIPAAYLAIKFFHLHHGINTYTQQVQSLNSETTDHPQNPIPPEKSSVSCNQYRFESVQVEMFE